MNKLIVLILIFTATNLAGCATYQRPLMQYSYNSEGLVDAAYYEEKARQDMVYENLIKCELNAKYGAGQSPFCADFMRHFPNYHNNRVNKLSYEGWNPNQVKSFKRKAARMVESFNVLQARINL